MQRSHCSLILSIALTLGVLVCIPVFSNAVSLRLMQEALSTRIQEQKHSAFSVRVYALPTVDQPINIQTALERRTWLADMFRQNMPLPIKSTYMEVEGGTFYLRTIKGDTHTRQTDAVLDVNHPVYVPEIESHINVITGTQYGQTPPGAQAGDLPVWVERYYAQKQDMQVGDRYDLGSQDTRIKPQLQIIIAGIWEAKDRAELYWYRDPVTDFSQRLVTTRAEFEKHIAPLVRGQTSFDSWYFVLDETSINLDNSEVYSTALQTIADEATKRLPAGKMDNAPLKELTLGQQRKMSLITILTGFAAPLILTLIYFVVSMSAMVAHFQRHEIALLSSRGAGPGHVLLLITLESLLIMLAALPLGVAIGMGMAHLMGYSSSFLKFETATRAALPVFIGAVDWRIVGAGVLISLLARWWPTWRASRQSVVAYERHSARPVTETPLAVRLVILALLLGVTYYAYRQVSLKGTLGAGKLADRPALQRSVAAGGAFALPVQRATRRGGALRADHATDQQTGGRVAVAGGLPGLSAPGTRRRPVSRAGLFAGAVPHVGYFLRLRCAQRRRLADRTQALRSRGRPALYPPPRLRPARAARPRNTPPATSRP